MPTWVLDRQEFFLKMLGMFLRAKSRFKDGQARSSRSMVETRRVQGKRVVPRQVWYLGEINGSQKAAWCKTIEVLREGHGQRVQRALFPEGQGAPALDCEVVRIKRSERPAKSGSLGIAVKTKPGSTPLPMFSTT